jgi:hypothetical protein
MILDTENINISKCKDLYDNLISPDTNNILYEITGYGDNKYQCVHYVILTKDEAEKFNSNEEELWLLFYSPVYTPELILKATETLEEYNKAKKYVDGVRDSDEQFDDPSLWYAEDKLVLLQDKKLKNMFWDYMIH